MPSCYQMMRLNFKGDLIMLKIISKIGALKAFYYLMSVDGVTSFEKERFHEIGLEILPDDFESIQEDIISECNYQIESVSKDYERYDIIQEGIDAALSDTVTDVESGVVPRLLVWNMLSLAHSDDDYSDNENRLIAHVTRILQIEKSVFVEMKQLISTISSVQKELELLTSSDRPYSEIKPLVDECENRRSTIMEAAKALIEDDILFDIPQSEPTKKKEVSLLNAGKKISESVYTGSKMLGEKISPITKDLGSKTAKGFKDASTLIGKKAGKGGADIKEGAGRLFSKMKETTKSNSISLPSKYVKIKKKLPEDMGLPKEAIAYNMANENTSALIICFPVSAEIAMDFDDPESFISVLHQDMDDDSGIIEVKAGTTDNGSKYIYHIMKRSIPSEDGIPLGNAYTINFNIMLGNVIQFINASFEEAGMTGMRDNMVYMMLRDEGLIDDNFSGWSCDPYDKSYNKGFLMNQSEQRKYDEMFPEHPLTEARRLVDYIIGTH